MDLRSLAGGVLWVNEATDVDALVSSLDSDWAVARQTIDEGSTKQAILAAIGEALDFPQWAGRSLDALYDLLTDLEWLTDDSGSARNVAVVLERSLDVSPEDWEKIVYVLLDAAAWWQPETRNFLAILR